MSSDDIIYLNDIGVASTVVTAMIQHDQAIKGSAPNIIAGNQTVPQPGTPTPYPETAVTAPLTPTEEVMADTMQPPPTGVNVSSGYFYDSLAPYGNWIDIAGYGRCWQPTVVVANPGWQPYCDRGHWVYSDCGWYWASDYSWGWAPFHYGRWFRHNRWGWCWAPDTVWGPSWVTWRYTHDYCGWAPLPPTACFTPGFGFTFRGSAVSVGFSFGLRADCFTFVSFGNVCDPHPFRHRLPHHNVTQIFNNTVVVNQIVKGRNNTIINEGIPVSRVESASRTPIRRVPVRDVSDPISSRGERVDRNGSRALGAFRPSLPQPDRPGALVGQGVKPAPRKEPLPRAGNEPGSRNGRTITSGTVSQQPAPAVMPRDRRTEPVPVIRNEPSNPSADAARVRNTPRQAVQPDSTPRDAGVAPNPGRNAPLVLRGSDPSGQVNRDRQTAPPRSMILTGPRNDNRGSVVNPPTPAPPVSPQTPPATPNPPLVTPRRFTMPSQQNSAPAQQNPQPNPWVQQTPRGLRDEPRFQRQQDQPQFNQPAAPAQPRSMPGYQWPPAAEPREQHRTFNLGPTPPVRQDPQPTFRNDPGPRYENRSTPQQHSAPPQQHNVPSRDNSRQDRGSGNGNGRNH